MEPIKKKGCLGGVLAVIVIAALVVCLFLSIERIPVGYEGVVYNMSGGVTGETLSQGWHLVAPTKKVKEFTVSNEQVTFMKSDDPEEDKSFKVATSDDASISVSFQMTYRFKSESLVDTYKKFRGMDGEDIVENRVNTVLRSKVSEVTAKYSMMDVYSGNKSEINNKITEHLNKEFTEAYGIEVIDASIVDVHPDEALQKTIDNRVKAVQEKQQAIAEQEKVKVEAETAKIKAENEAEIKVLNAKAEAEANKLKAASITDELIRMKEAEARVKHGWVEVNGAATVVRD